MLGLVSCRAEPRSGLLHGLSPAGREQAARAPDALRAQLLRARGGGGAGAAPADDDVWIYTSDFRRTRETAEALRDGLGLARDRVRLAPQLRERDFGAFNLCADRPSYEATWAADADAARPLGLWAEAAVEPAAAVQARASAFVAGLERAHRGATVCLVAHGDLLQILQTAFARRPAETHRSLPHLDTAEVRLLELAPRAE